MKIIVPIDFSDNSIKALELAILLSEKGKTEITIVHIIELVYDFASQAAVALDSLHKESAKLIKELEAKYSNSGVKFDHEIHEGTASISIARIAKEREATLIIMGTRGATGIKKTLFGSTAVNLLKEANCPVLVVPESTQINQLQRITLALEFANHEPESIDKVVALSQLLNLYLEFLHVQTTDGFKEDLAVLGLEKYIQNKFPHLPVRFYTYYGETASEGLDGFLEEHQHMILGMCHHHRGLMESIFKKSHSFEMAYHTEVPLLIIL
ncbi:universal stress protein [Algoriphagus lacus]|uniref:Universal stress protein n=1 Tax=Algoriphagus lacus TaxID=2056311 RepID=A0A418PM55_9BACT|nr:universal stress protein [Algoriphagus lacus]RIW12704.1 universal stress protein [Algoriphagus lacus]